MYKVLCIIKVYFEKKLMALETWRNKSTDYSGLGVTKGTRGTEERLMKVNSKVAESRKACGRLTLIFKKSSANNKNFFLKKQKKRKKAQIQTTKYYVLLYFLELKLLFLLLPLLRRYRFRKKF